ncbi:hypothetical protein CRYUN_Cryun23aG0013400 [Craigia yunnanensis]
METRDHIFFTCVCSKQLRRKLLSAFGISRLVGDYHEELLWAKKKLRGTAFITVILRIAWNTYIYSLRQERNNRLHGGSSRSDQILFCSITDIVRSRLAGFENIARDPVNESLCSAWGLCDSMFAWLIASEV